MYFTIIKNRQKKFIVISSITGEPYKPNFKTYKECKHFVAFWYLQYKDMLCDDVYIKWCNIYYNKNKKFIGSLSDWNYKNVSLVEDTFYERYCSCFN